MPASVRLRAYAQRQAMEEASPFSQILWRCAGPEIQSGRVIDFEVPIDNPGRWYVAYATGGLWRSDDRGNTWTPLFDGQSAYAIGDVAVSEDGATIWVGTGENNSQRTSYSGTGVFRSDDSGATWRHVGLEGTHRIGRIVLDPKDPKVAYVGALGALYTRNPERGVYKTTDGGKTWEHVLKLDDKTGVIDLVMEPGNPNVLYASTWERERRTWNFREGGAGTGIYKSVNAGKTWTRLGNGLPQWSEIGRIGLAVAPSKPNVVYAFIDNQSADAETWSIDERQPSGVLTPRRFKLLDAQQFGLLEKSVVERFVGSYLPEGTKAEDLQKAVKEGTMTLDDVAQKMEERNKAVFHQVLKEAEVYRSDDGGRSWRKTHEGRIGSHGEYYCGRVIVNPNDADELVTTGWELLRSKDGGKTWTSGTGRMHVDFHAYYFDSKDPAFQVAGNDGGLYLSYDAGANWRHVIAPVGQTTTLALDDKTPYNIIVGLQDNGTLIGPSTYRAGQSDPSLWKMIGGGDGSAIAVDPRDGGDFLYLSFQFGAFYTVDQKTRARGFLSVPDKPGETLRWNWIAPVQVSPHHPDIVMLGSQRVHRSLDRGKTWHDMGPDLTKNLPNGDVPYSTLKDLSESPLQFGLIYAGADDGSVKVTRDHGGSWTDISTPEKDKWVSRVVASKWGLGTVYVSQSGYRDDEWTPYLWKSTDFGKTWASIVGDLPAETINVVREDPRRKDLLYVGTDLGVFVSYNGGANWVPLAGGLPRTPVHDLAVHPKVEEMVIATHARSAWVLSLKQVYQLNEELKAKPLHVWPVEPMRRAPRWGLDRDGEWDTSAPRAPRVTGQLWVAQPGPGTIRLLDKEGKVVKEAAATWARGFNTFEFDLQLTPGQAISRLRERPKPEDALKDPYGPARPTYVAAGDYKLEFVAGSHTVTVDWKLTS